MFLISITNSVLLSVLSASTFLTQPDPLPLAGLAISEMTEEVKDPELTFPGEECNCWAYVKNRLPELTNMASIIPNTEAATGTVAVEWYGDIKHVAIVTKVEVSGVWVEEANYNHCQTGERFIPFTKHSLVGFWTPTLPHSGK